MVLSIVYKDRPMERLYQDFFVSVGSFENGLVKLENSLIELNLNKSKMYWIRLDGAGTGGINP